ncbi:amidohydrolase [Candidatus Micrarchaeota archaeon]|nr:amidohydrolase [Candidatus Micrarchaeota archaeon]
MSSLLIKDTTVLLPTGSVSGHLYVDEDKISDIGSFSLSGKKSDLVIDGSGKLLMPGFANMHTHVSLQIFRGYGEGLPLERWLKEKIWPAEEKQTPAQVRAAANLAFCEMIKSGTTCFADMCIFDPLPVFDSASKFGIRGSVSRGILNSNDDSKNSDLLDAVQNLCEYGTDLVSPSISAHAPYTCSKELLIQTKKLAKKKGLKYQIHVSETRKEVFEILDRTGKYPIEYLDSIGLLDSDSIFAHCGWLTKREISLLGKNKVNIVSCPVSNLKLATGGICQLHELDAAGANVSLGTDSVASNNSLNMFETLKFAALLQKHHYWKADVLSAKRAFEFATVNGYHALGLNGGIIKKGALADMVLLDKSANLRPVNDIYSNLVYSASPANISHVIIGGKLILKDGKFTTVDEEQIFREADNAAADLFG